MKLKINCVALAGALTTSIWYSMIALLMKIWPNETLQFISAAHMIPRLENLIPYLKITPAAIFTSISIHFVSAYLFFFLIALLYNLLASLDN